MRRLVIVADNSLIVDAIRRGLRQSGQFNLVGRADMRTTTGQTVVGARPNVVLLDDTQRSARVIEIIREIRAMDECVSMIVLTLHLDASWLEQLFNAGACAAISKEVHPTALGTLVREAVNGHIVQSFPRTRVIASPAATAMSAKDLPLTNRELEILKIVAAGLSNADVARRLWVTEQTVKFHLRNVFRKLGVANRTEASHFAHVHGLVATELEASPALTLAS